MEKVVLTIEGNQMTDEQLNRLITSSTKVEITTKSKRVRRRSKNGEPQPYWDGNRAKHVGYFVGANGKKHKVIGTGATLAQATRSRNQKLEQLQKSMSVIHLPKELITVGGYCTYWLEEVAQGSTQLAPKTYGNYLNAKNKWITPIIGEIELVNLTSRDIKQVFAAMAQAGLGRSSQNQVRTVLHQMILDAIHEGYIVHDPTSGVRLLKSRRALPVFFTGEERRIILEKAKVLGTELDWTLALKLGLRQGERLGITWDCVHLDEANPYLIIDKQLQRVRGKGLVLVPVKTQTSNRLIPLSPEIQRLFVDRLEVAKIENLVHGEIGARDLVFRAKSGGAVDNTVDSRAWKKLLQAAGVRYLSVHKARHTTATLLDAPLQIKKQLLGHSSIQVTSDMYSGFDVAALRRALSAD
jgi:integrase